MTLHHIEIEAVSSSYGERHLDVTCICGVSLHTTNGPIIGWQELAKIRSRHLFEVLDGQKKRSYRA